MTHNPTILRKTLPLYKEVHFIWRGQGTRGSMSKVWRHWRRFWHRAHRLHSNAADEVATPEDVEPGCIINRIISFVKRMIGMNGDDKHNKIPVPNALIKMLKEFEGLRLTAYRDIGGGAWTIGYGHTGSDVTEGMTITEKEAEDFLLKDASKSLNLLLESSPALKSTSENRLVAVADFVFNLGIGNYNKSTFKQRVDAQDWEKAAEECKKWTKAGGKVLPGLVKRRDAEVKLLLES